MTTPSDRTLLPALRDAHDLLKTALDEGLIALTASGAEKWARIASTVRELERAGTEGGEQAKESQHIGTCDSHIGLKCNCGPTPTAPAMAWDAEAFVQQFMEWRNYRSRPNIVALAEAAHAAGVGARVPLPEEMPDWFSRWFETYEDDEPVTHSRSDWQREAWKALRAKLGGSS